MRRYCEGVLDVKGIICCGQAQALNRAKLAKSIIRNYQRGLDEVRAVHVEHAG